CPDGCSMGVCLNKSNKCEIVNTTTKTCSWGGVDYTITARGCMDVSVDVSYSHLKESYNMYAIVSSSNSSVHQATLGNGIKLT
ncbi:hypothetical protein ABK046_49550, partial [Streptomyces caeruleatus]